MTTAANIDLAVLSRELELPLERVEQTLQLLEDGNTIPFITRYRKERTGGLNEEQIQRIQQEATKSRLLTERKQSILRSIESQGKLTPELAAKINSARTVKWLEDVYLPYKPKKQTLATMARQRGLESLAKAIFEADPAAQDLEKRAADFLVPDKGLNTVEEVLQGVRHLLAEMFSERVDIRARLRKSLRRDGVLICSKIESVKTEGNEGAHGTEGTDGTDGTEGTEGTHAVGENAETAVPAAEVIPAVCSELVGGESQPSVNAEVQVTEELTHELPSLEAPSQEALAEPVVAATGGVRPDRKGAPKVGKNQPTRKQLAKERKKKLLEHAFKDYYNFREALSRLPPHRTLAINRGERAKVLRIRIEYDAPALIEEAVRHLIPVGHVHANYLSDCARDALQRLLLPSLERELRRELAEEAEQHALQVFIRNLRKLLLQPPVPGKRVLAVDPGFRSGCKLAAIDAFGNVLEHGMIHLIGNEEQRKQARTTLADFIRRNQSDLVAIGNGAGCRSAEQIVADVIGNELSDTPIAYLIVNEAGASVYSTSQIGRDELPHCDPMMRSAISIGRRLQDPLSELVKINPANIGVGMYQHDMKVKHLRDSLDAVVNSCVNFVGVELNTASPSLLGYVSGLNQLTARRIFEHRRQHGPFRSREQLKDVPGIGEATFVQAAGFLRISDGDNPLDATWIHPESYDVARRMLERLGISLDVLGRGAGSASAGASSSTSATVPSPSLNEMHVDIPTEPAQSPASGDAVIATESPLPLETASGGPSAESHSLTVPPVSAANEERSEKAVSPAAAVHPEASVAVGSPDAIASSEAVPSPAASSPESSSSESSSSESAASWVERLNDVKAHELAQELGVGEVLVNDILAALAKKGRDPRDDFSPPPFRTGIMKLENLKPGMAFQGTVLNVVDFGAFVDIGMSDSALVHISKLADQFIRDPQEVVSVGDILRVWVIDVDKERRRVSLTAIDPNAERRPRERRETKPRRPVPPQRPAQPASQRLDSSSGTPPPPRPARAQQQQRPPRPPSKKPPFKSPSRSGGPPPPPKPVRPITTGMLTGKQPMRSFSDLLQFYEKKSTDTNEK